MDVYHRVSQISLFMGPLLPFLDRTPARAGTQQSRGLEAQLQLPSTEDIPTFLHMDPGRHQNDLGLCKQPMGRLS